MKLYKIFISSPGDVRAERQVAARVVDRVEAWCGGRVRLECYLWEHEPMMATKGDFQEQIPDAGTFDLVVCLFWSRLGSRLHPGRHKRSDGSPYSSGTEYEFEQALAAFRLNGKPEMLVYRRQEKPKIPVDQGDEADRIRSQWAALDTFWKHWFHDEDEGTFRMAHATYNNAGDFETSFEEHLKTIVARFLEKSGEDQIKLIPKRLWQGTPYRGLQTFNLEHEPIFFGRTSARDDVLTALRTRATEEQCPFVMIYGASGSGKSSLMRAGVLPWLIKPGVIDGIEIWRYAMIRPADFDGDLLHVLATGLIKTGALPEILKTGITLEQIVMMLRDDPKSIVGLIERALILTASVEQKRVELEKGDELLKAPIARLALGLDQVEEVFTLQERFSHEDRRQFFKAIWALARSGHVWIVTTLRSDFYSRCEEVPELIDLTRGLGQYRLLPPTEIELSQMIRLPAEAAGVAFEEDSKKGKLDELIARDAKSQAGALPLLEYALEMLYEKGAQENLLTHSQYEEIGGVVGAVARKAEQTCAALPRWVQESLNHFFQQLIILSDGDAEVPTRRTVLESNLLQFPGADEVLTAFVEARLFTKDTDNQGQTTITLSHEALLKLWDRAVRWIDDNRTFLRQRGRLALALRVWQTNMRHGDYLLSAGLPLAEAESLLKEHRRSLTREEITFVKASQDKALLAERRRTRIRRMVITSLSVLTIGAITSAIFAVFEKDRAIAARNQAEDILDYIVFDLRDELAPVGRLDIVSRMQKKVSDYYQNLGVDGSDPDQLRRRGVALQNEGDLLSAQGKLKEALDKFQQAQSIAEKLATTEPDQPTVQRDLALTDVRVGDTLAAKGDSQSALIAFGDAEEIERKLHQADPQNTSYAQDLGVCFEREGTVQQAVGKLDDALKSFQDSIKVREESQKNGGDGASNFAMSTALTTLGDTERARGDLEAALACYQQALEIDQKLIASDSMNQKWQRHLAVASERVGSMEQDKGKIGPALDAYKQALQINEQQADRDPTNMELLEDLGASFVEMGNAEAVEGNMKDSLKFQQSALRVRTELTQKDPTNEKWQRLLVWSMEQTGSTEEAVGEIPQAQDLFKSALDLTRKLAAHNPNVPQYQLDIIRKLNDSGILQKRVGTLDIALKTAMEALDDARKLNGNYPEHPTFEKALGDCCDEVGAVNLDQQKFADALKYFQEGLAIRQQLSSKDLTNKEWQRSVIVSFSECGDANLRLLKYDEAVNCFQQALTISRQLSSADPSNANLQRDLSNSLMYVGDVEQVQGKNDLAVQSYQEALGIRKKLMHQDASNIQLQLDVGESLKPLIVLKGAAQFQPDIHDLESTIGQDPKNGEALKTLGFLKLLQHDFKGADDDYAKGIAIESHDTSVDSSDLIYGYFDLWICEMRQKEQDKANQQLKQNVAPYLKKGLKDWTTHVANFLTGGETEPVFLAAAKLPGEHCEAWYYTGIKHLFQGDKAGAQKDFQNAVSTHVTNWLEFMLAKSELKKL